MEELKKNPRLFLRNFLSLDQCKELQFIHRSCSTVGYRSNVFSTTLSHLVATNCSHFIMPLVTIREMLKDKVEEFFGCEYELFIEFTGLISWARGASIGWHSDDNRPYLKQRDFTAVCYLNSYGEHFEGGLFHFQDGEPRTVVPSAGDVLIYTADSRNIHSVDEIIDGERVTLTLWFSRNSTHDEDVKLISRLTQIYSSGCGPMPVSYIPTPASSNMYLYSPDQSSNDGLAVDIFCARIYTLGFSIYSSQDKNKFLEVHDLLSNPLQLVRGGKLFDHEFANILHALQVVQYYTWKASELQNPVDTVVTGKLKQLTSLQSEITNDLKSAFIKDQELALKIFSSVSCDESSCQEDFDWTSFFAAVAAWNKYSSKLQEDLLLSLPYWRTQESIFNVAFGEL